MNNQVIKFRAWDFYQKIMIEPHEPVLLNKIIPLIHGDKSEWHSSTGLSGYRLMQFTGFQDKNGEDIYEGDLLNVYYTFGNGEHIHDCIYEVVIGCLGDLQLVFRELLFLYYGYNQYPISTRLCLEHKTLGTKRVNGKEILIVRDTGGESISGRREWKENDESEYFEVIGNIHENPELLEQKQ